jgi:hypothetical protein
MGLDPWAAGEAGAAVPLTARTEFRGRPGPALSVRPEQAPAALERAVPVPTDDRDALRAVARPTEAKRHRASQVANQEWDSRAIR